MLLTTASVRTRGKGHPAEEVMFLALRRKSPVFINSVMNVFFKTGRHCCMLATVLASARL